MKTGIIKKVGLGVVSFAMLLTTACNTKINVSYDCNAKDYVKLGTYKGIEVTVNESAIENEMIEKRVQNDLDTKTTYDEVSREAREEDQVTVDFTGSIGGNQIDGFSNNDYSLVLGKDTFVIDGFIDALYGMKAGETKVVTLQVPENFQEEQEYSGRKIVYEITMNKVEQPNAPMITDAYVKEEFGYDTVEAYREYVKGEVQSAIDESVESAKKQAVLTKLQDNCEVLGYPEDYVATKTEDFSKSISFYAMMQGLSNDEYCQKNYNMSFDDYVKKAVVQELIFQLIVEQEGLTITEYDYKGDLQAFADKMGYSDKSTFVEKYGKDKIVKNMLLQQAQDIVMNSAVYNIQ